MSRFEKIINISMKLTGIIYVIDSIVILLGYFTPSAFGSGVTHLCIATFLLMSTYSKPNKTKEDHK
ncbi:MAG TPA: hypothetical protein VIM42_11430 [Clostridium sp.]